MFDSEKKLKPWENVSLYNKLHQDILTRLFSKGYQRRSLLNLHIALLSFGSDLTTISPKKGISGIYKCPD